MKLSEIAERLGGALTGTDDPEISGLARIEEAEPGQLTFVANPKYTAEAKKTHASAIVVAPDFPEIDLPALRVANPDLAFARAILPDLVTLNPQRDDIGARVRAATEGEAGCDVVLECVGNEHALKACLDAVRKQGVVVQTGLHPHDNPLDWFQVTFKDVDLRGAWAYPTHYWPRVIRMIASGVLPAAKIVTARIRLDDAVAQGFDALLDPSGKHLKILIDLAA